jgi:hypothetical protein
MTVDQLEQLLTEDDFNVVIERVSQLVSAEVRGRIDPNRITSLIEQTVRNAVAEATTHYQHPGRHTLDYDQDALLNSVVVEFNLRTEHFLQKLVTEVKQNLNSLVHNTVNSAEIIDLIRNQTTSLVINIVKEQQFQFPPESIPGQAVHHAHVRVRAENILPGVIGKFESTGIQDTASQTQVVVMDQSTVIENELVVQDLTVNGSIDVRGTVNDSLIERIATVTLNKIEAKLPEGTLGHNNIDRDSLMSLLVQTLVTSMREEIHTIMQNHTDADQIRSTVHTEIVNLVRQCVSNYQWPNTTVNANVDDHSVINGVTNEFRVQTREYLERLIKFVQEQVVVEIYNTVSELDIRSLVIERTSYVVTESLRNGSFQFPAHSIPAAAVQITDLRISADNILPGIVKDFESTGIQDNATQTQLVILDDVTVVENSLVTKDLEVAGNIKLSGDIDPKFLDRIATHTKNFIESKYNSGTYDEYCNRVLDKLSKEGIDAGQIRAGETALLDENLVLNSRITQTNIKKLGVLNELQVQGETLLDETVYVSNKRMGINTLDPERALDIWDQEVQIVAGKRSKDTGIFGTSRNQDLILSANNRHNLVLKPDGSVVIEQLGIGKTVHTSALDVPFDNRPMGTIVWNERPTIGAPIGWVSLGGARWAKFGTISE